jgi:parvulin-like peptidyl-prolyl isomerase
VRSAYGWHILETLESDTVKTRAGKDSLDAKGQPAIELHVRHILIRVPVSEADAQRAKTLADRVQQEARKGTDFATLVRRYSKYEGQQGPDGDLGFVSMGSLQPHIRAGLDSLELGQVSEVLPNQVGYNIFKLVDRKPEREYQLEEIRSDLPELVSQMKQRERYDEWVKTLRTKAHIEIRRS